MKNRGEFLLDLLLKKETEYHRDIQPKIVERLSVKALARTLYPRNNRSFFCSECYEEFYGQKMIDNAEALRKHVQENPCEGYRRSNKSTTYVLPNPEPTWFPKADLAPIPCDDFFSNVGSGECGHCGHTLGDHRWKYKRCPSRVGDDERFCRRCGRDEKTHHDLPLRLSRFFGDPNEEWM